MKRLTAISLLLFAGLLSSAFGQGTSVITATITDPDGQTWNNGSYSINLVMPAGSTQSPVWVRTPTSAGIPFQQSYGGTLNSAGAFGITLPDTSFISPAGAQWNFNLCSNTSAPCQSVTTAVTGVSVNLSSTLSNALTAPRFNAGQAAFGYLDVEVNAPSNSGAIYYNVTNQILKCWSGSAWAACGAGATVTGSSPIVVTGNNVACPTCGTSLATVESFTASLSNWPNWLTPNVTNPTTTPSLFVAPTTGQTSHQVIGTCGTATAFAPCALVAGDLPSSITSSTSGTAANLSGTPLLPNGTTGATQTNGDNSAKLATDAFVIANAGSSSASSIAGAIICVDTSGSANSITCSTTPSLSSLPNPGYFLITPNNTNTGATTITVSSASAVSVVYNAANGTALTGGELVKGVQTMGYYDGTHMRIYKGYDLDVASFPGSTADAKYANALASVPSSDVFVTLNGTNLPGPTQTLNANFLQPTVGSLTCPVAGKVIWPAAVMIVNAPIVTSCFTLEGKGNSHTGSLSSGTALEAGASLVPAFAGTGNVAASSGGSGGSSYQFVVTGTSFASQIGDVFSICSASLGQVGTACLGTAATTQARGTVIAASSTSLTVESSAAVSAASGVNFVTFPCVLCMGDNSGQSSGVPAESGIEAYKFDIDCQVNSIAGCIPLFVSSAQNLSKAHDLTLKPYNDAGFELMTPASQQFSLHDIWVASGTNTTSQAYCGVSRIGSSNIADIRNLACFLSSATTGLIIDDGTRWGGQLHMVGAYTSAIEAGFAPTLPYVSFNGPSSSIAGMVIEDVDLNGSTSALVNGVSIASGQSNYEIGRVFKSSGTVTNLINDATTGCTDPTSGEKYLSRYVVNSNGQIALSTSPAATCQPQIGVGINTQTGTTYTYSATTDLASLTNFSNASAVAATLPESNTFPLNWFNKSCNLGAGTVTITPTVSTITYTTGSSVVSAASSVAITTGQCVYLYANNASSGNTFLGNVALSSSGGVSSVSNSDGSLTISPTTGAAVASLNTANANTFTATQTFPANSITNAELANSATTVNSQLCTLGSTCTVTVAIGSGVTGLGTGVATALADAAGASGGMVTVGGAAGTPSSINLANATFPAAVTYGSQNTTQGVATVAGGSSAANGQVVLCISGASCNGSTLTAGANSAAITLTLPTSTGTIVESTGTLANHQLVLGSSAGVITSTGSITSSGGTIFNNYNGEATAGIGTVYERGAASQSAETGTAATLLTVTPASAVGTYRACVSVSVSAATSGVIGWTLSWTDSNGNAQSNAAMSLFQQGTAAPALTFTTSAAGNYGGCYEFDVNNAGSAIAVKWVGGGTTTAKVSATVERLQ